MARGRVQVNDLQAPDRLQVAPVQSDTFAAPPQPVIDNNLENLSKALGFFGNAVQSHLNDPERKKALKDAQLAEWEKWKSARTSTEQLDAIRTGKAPYWSDPFIGEVVKRDYAGMEATKLSEDLDRDLQEGRVAKFGQPTFDPDAFLVERAKSTVERVGRDPASMAAFGDQLDKLRTNFRAKHQEALGVTQTQAIENVAYTQLDNVVTRAIEDGLDGNSITAGLKGIYKDLGPRVKGGSLDIKYGRLDDILLEVMQKRVKDPRYARKVLEMLESERVGVDGQTPIGSLKTVARHSDKVASIQNVAVKVLADEYEDNTKAQVLQADVTALKNRDGAFSTIMDLNTPNKVDKSRTVKASSTERKDRAVQAFLEETRIKNQGQPNFDEEFDVMLKNGVKHPEWVPFLQSAYVGIANTNVSAGPGPDQIQRIIQAGQLYGKIADRNYTYISSSETGVTRPAQEFYETFNVLTRQMGRTPEQAAIETARVFSSAQNAQDPMVVQGRLRDIEDKAKSLDFSSVPFAGGVNNAGEMVPRIIDLAKVYSRVEGMDAETAIKAARDRIEQSAVNINGRAILDPGIQRGDEEWVQGALDDAYKLNPNRFAELGMDDAKDMSLAPFGNGKYLVINARGGPPPVVPVYDKDGKLISARPMTISTADIQKRRSAGEKKLKDEAVKDAVKQNSEMSRDPNQYYDFGTP
jgi:hypothetical protein